MKEEKQIKIPYEWFLKLLELATSKDVSPDEREDVRISECWEILRRLSLPNFGHSQDCCSRVKNLIHSRIADLEDKVGVEEVGREKHIED